MMLDMSVKFASKIGAQLQIDSTSKGSVAEEL